MLQHLCHGLGEGKEENSAVSLLRPAETLLAQIRGWHPQPVLHKTTDGCRHGKLWHMHLSPWVKISKSTCVEIYHSKFPEGREKRGKMQDRRGPDETATLSARSMVSERLSRTWGYTIALAIKHHLAVDQIFWQSVLWGRFVLEPVSSLPHICNKSREPERSFRL